MTETPTIFDQFIALHEARYAADLAEHGYTGWAVCPKPDDCTWEDWQARRDALCAIWFRAQARVGRLRLAGFD
jgi:hypothetical protein